MIDFFAFLFLFLFSVQAVRTDLMYRRIRNSWILVGLFFAVLIFVFKLVFVGYNVFFLLNFLLIFVFSFGLFFLDYLAAGDSKFLIVSGVFLLSVFEQFFVFRYLFFVFGTFYLYAIVRFFKFLSKRAVLEVFRSFKFVDVFIYVGVFLLVSSLRFFFVFLNSLFDFSSFFFSFKFVDYSGYVFFVLVLACTYLFFKLFRKFLKRYKKLLVFFLILVLPIRFYFGVELLTFVLAFVFAVARYLVRFFLNSGIDKTSFVLVDLKDLDVGMILKEGVGGFRAGTRVTAFNFPQVYKEIEEQSLSRVKIELEVPFSIFIAFGNFFIFLFWFVRYVF